MENIDDVGFTTSIIQHSAKNWSTCPERTLIAGYSNGGHMCYRLALELGSRYIAGVAVHCANLPTDDNSDCSTLLNDAVPICIVNGTAGEICFPYETIFNQPNETHFSQRLSQTL
jgi:polyhydroxybutyrate depolymerase